MKIILTIPVVLMLAHSGHTQTFAEWFHQNSTRLKYYGQQVAALEIGLTELQKGYQIASTGLGVINKSKQGEFGLHSTYYTSLGDINPAIGQTAEIAEIIALQVAIINRFSQALTNYRLNGQMGADQLAYISQVYNRLLQAGLADATSLADLLTADKLKLTDDQRLGRIRELDVGTRDRYAFTLAFTDRADLLQQQTTGEAADLYTLKALYEKENVFFD